jgi:hypothetical protein
VDQTLVADQSVHSVDSFLVNDKCSYSVISYRLWLCLAAVAVEIVHCVGWDSVCCRQLDGTVCVADSWMGQCVLQTVLLLSTEN